MKKNPSPTLPLSGEGATRKTELSPLSGEGDKPPAELVVNTQVTPCHRSAPPPGKGEAGRGLKPQLHNRPQQKSTRRQLRKTPTEPEKHFWSWVRGKQLGTKFRRQQGIGHYIVDFYSAEHALIVEIDGDSHYDPEAIAYDAVRTDFLKTKGFRVVRFTNREIMQNKEGVLMSLMAIFTEANHDG